MKIRNAKVAAEAVDQIGLIEAQIEEQVRQIKDLRAGLKAYMQDYNGDVFGEFYRATVRQTTSLRLKEALVRRRLGDATDACKEPVTSCQLTVRAYSHEAKAA